MISYANSELFFKDSVNKQWKITATKNGKTVGVFTNEDIQNDSINITEALTSGDGLEFGRCESNYFTCIIHNVSGSLKECDLDVTVSLDGKDPFRIGYYKVKSDKPTADRYHRKIIAYDLLYDINEKDVGPWYKDLKFPMTIKQMRDSLFKYLGVVQEEAKLVNDDITVDRTIDHENGIGANSILTAICEINGAFGHITRDNKFRYVILQEYVEGLYPRTDLFPATNLYPKGDVVDFAIERNQYNDVEYEDYSVQKIDAVVILGEDNEIATATSTSSKNPFTLENNFLLYDLSKETLGTIAKRILTVIGHITYIPVTVECLANPCIEVGDSIRFGTNEKIIFTYVLSRTMSGLQYLQDSLESTGDEYRDKDLNSISKQLARLANKSKYDIDVNTARIKDLEADHVSVAQLNATKADIRNLSAEVAIITGDLYAANANIQNLTAENVTIKGNISTLNGNLSTVNGKISTINGNISTINGSISSINGDISTANGNISALNGAVTALRGEFDVVKANYISSASLNTAVNNALQGTATIGTVRAGAFKLYDGQDYRSMHVSQITISNRQYNIPTFSTWNYSGGANS